MPLIAGTRAPSRTMRPRQLPCQGEVIRTLLYYDIWDYPLTRAELYAFLPVPARSTGEFEEALRRLVEAGAVGEDRGYYFVPGTREGSVDNRLRGEAHARRLWRMAKIAAHVIKRFPFVRGIFVSGDLSKNMTNRESDVDFLILTEPGRLWIARMLLIAFKKTVLLNRKKFFCVNSFASTDNLRIAQKNIYQASEIAQLKPLFNTRLFDSYIEANGWIRGYFPNFHTAALAFPRPSDRPSFLQRILEIPFALLPSDSIDVRLMGAMERVWARRYPALDAKTRAEIFKCARGESRAYAGNFQGKVLMAYERKLRQHGAGN
jgi:hypothetical protein